MRRTQTSICALEAVMEMDGDLMWMEPSRTTLILMDTMLVISAVTVYYHHLINIYKRVAIETELNRISGK